MTQHWPQSLPEHHRTFLQSAIDKLRHDTRIAGIAAGGSFVTDAMDEFSDLDLVIGVEPDAGEGVMADRQRIAGSLGPLLATFTGEHLREPRLLICLYEDTPPLHVDLKFVVLSDLSQRVEDPSVLWERDGRFTEALRKGRAEWPLPDAQWIEDRFWVWIHYVAGKIGRGEIFEALDGLSFLRSLVLGPLAMRKSGARPAGLRRLEQLAPAFTSGLQSTVAGYDALDCLCGLRACVDLYRSLRVGNEPASPALPAETAVTQYLDTVEQWCVRHHG